ncbi:MAG TPA: EfeM/EfeO family lipoprotein [Acidimicrobiia bacterium]|nr:EfeM/EfeO family lipoprotein [Acidimicrobiia bacterium]
MVFFSAPERETRTRVGAVILCLVLSASTLSVVGVAYAESGSGSGLRVSSAAAVRVVPNEIVVTASECAPGWRPPGSGTPTFTVRNTTSDPYAVELFGSDGLTVFGRIEMLGPLTERPLRVSLPPGQYFWRCQDFAGAVTFSSTETVRGVPVRADPYRPVTNGQITEAVIAYRERVADGLTVLANDTAHLLAVVETGDMREARVAWLVAHLQYERLGAAYSTFGDFADEIDGRADGLPGGVHDMKFTGFHRLEYALWHDEPRATVTRVARELDRDVDALMTEFADLGTGPNDVSLRTHEILENALQFELTGDTDEGSHTNLATVRANVDGTRLALSAIAPLLRRRDPALLQRATAGLDRLAVLLDGCDTNGTWRPLSDLTRPEHEQLDSTVSGLLETLSPIPDILELDPNDGD